MTVDLILGDVLEVLKDYPDESFVAVFCDPPYGLGKQPNMEEVLRHWLAGHDYKGSFGFMNSAWDGFVPGPATWKEVYRVLKPGAVLLAFAGTRTVDMLSIALRLAGFHKFDEIDHFYGGLPPQISYLFGSGFPKSASISKMLDKAAGKEREVVGHRQWNDPMNKPYTNAHYGGERVRNDIPFPITAPATDAAKVWEGYGTALKPAHEIILCFRKPRRATYAATCLEHGSSALNINGCRVGAHRTTTTIKDFSGAHGNQWGKAGIAYPKVGEKVNPPGRWPANLLFSHSDCERVGVKRVKSQNPQYRREQKDIRRVPTSYNMPAQKPGISIGYADPDGLETVAAYRCSPDCPVAMLDRQSGVGKSRMAVRRNVRGKPTSGFIGRQPDTDDFGYTDTGGSSRFFQCFEGGRFYYAAKAPRSERERGLRGHLPCLVCDEIDSEYHLDKAGRKIACRRCGHPTVKPLALCEYLARLIVAPPEYRDEAQLLVPFMGSGSEIIGALKAGWRNVTGIDNMAEYLKIAELRIAAHMKEPQQMTLGGD